MGACNGCQSDNKESRSSRLISEELRKEKRLKGFGWYGNGNRHEIIILGSDNSGKTALFNQLHQLCTENTNINSKQELHIIKDIRQNCIDNIYVLCDMMHEEKSMQLLETYSIDNLAIIGKTISNLWNKSSFKIKYSYRHFYATQYFMDDNMNYFFDKINIIMDTNYHPSFIDILKHRSTNRSFNDIEFKTNDHIFKISDVGTVRDELYWKQLHYFSTMSVIFMVDLSGYCKCILEDEELNDMNESLQCFDRIVNTRYLRQCEITLLFNKNELFKKCLKDGISIKLCFPDYKGAEYNNFKLPMIASFVSREIEKELEKMIPMEVIKIIELYLKMRIAEKYANMTDEQYFDVCYKETLEYIQYMYINRSGDQYRQIYSHVGDAIDAQRISKIFDDIKHCIIVHNLAKNGS
eukprot:294901_1